MILCICHVYGHVKKVSVSVSKQYGADEKKPQLRFFYFSEFNFARKVSQYSRRFFISRSNPRSMG